MRLPVRNTFHQFVEALERRQFLSASVASAVAPALVSSVAPQLVKLGPSKVEGTYKGTITGADGATYETKLVLTATSARLTVEGLGTYASSLSAKQFLKIREGTFSVAFKYVSGLKGSVTLTGKVTDSGLRISGSYVNSASRTGTFSLKR